MKTHGDPHCNLPHLLTPAPSQSPSTQPAVEFCGYPVASHMGFLQNDTRGYALVSIINMGIRNGRAKDKIDGPGFEK